MEQKSAKKERIIWYDNTKFTLICLVVIGHFVEFHLGESRIYQSLYLFIYTFHMPLFVFIAGLFHETGNCFKKFISNVEIGGALQIWSLFYNIFTTTTPTVSFFAEISLPWFMYTLAAYEVIACAAQNLNKTKFFICSCVFACFIGYDPSIGDNLVLSRIFVFLPFYLAGILISKEKLHNMVKNRKILKIVGGGGYNFIWLAMS